MHKLDALTRILEAETFDGMLIFVRTKAETVELADKLSARGFNATALNGDMEQKSRERVIAKLKNRSEEHTSELQSLMRISYAVFCLKKKKSHLQRHNCSNTLTYITRTSCNPHYSKPSTHQQRI